MLLFYLEEIMGRIRISLKRTRYVALIFLKEPNETLHPICNNKPAIADAEILLRKINEENDQKRQEDL